MARIPVFRCIFSIFFIYFFLWVFVAPHSRSHQNTTDSIEYRQQIVWKSILDFLLQCDPFVLSTTNVRTVQTYGYTTVRSERFFIHRMKNIVLITFIWVCRTMDSVATRNRKLCNSENSFVLFWRGNFIGACICA